MHILIVFGTSSQMLTKIIACKVYTHSFLFIIITYFNGSWLLVAHRGSSTSRFLVSGSLCPTVLLLEFTHPLQRKTSITFNRTFLLPFRKSLLSCIIDSFPVPYVVTIWKPVQWGLCEYVIVNTNLPPSPVILWI